MEPISTRSRIGPANRARQLSREVVCPEAICRTGSRLRLHRARSRGGGAARRPGNPATGRRLAVRLRGTPDVNLATLRGTISRARRRDLKRAEGRQRAQRRRGGFVMLSGALRETPARQLSSHGSGDLSSSAEWVPEIAKGQAVACNCAGGQGETAGRCGGSRCESADKESARCADRSLGPACGRSSHRKAPACSDI